MTANSTSVYGSYGSKKHSNWRNLGSTLVNTFYRVTFHTDVTITSFRILRRQLLECIFSYNLNFTFIDGLLAWNTQRIGEVEVEHRPRSQGPSGYNVFKLISLAFNLFTNFSLVPLQLISFCGFASAVGGLLVAAYLFDSVPLAPNPLSRLCVDDHRDPGARRHSAPGARGSWASTSVACTSTSIASRSMSSERSSDRRPFRLDRRAAGRNLQSCPIEDKVSIRHDLNASPSSQRTLSGSGGWFLKHGQKRNTPRKATKWPSGVSQLNVAASDSLIGNDGMRCIRDISN